MIKKFSTYPHVLFSQVSPDKYNSTEMSMAARSKKKFAEQQQLTPPPPETTKILSLFSDTTRTLDVGASSCEAMSKLFQDENPKVVERKATSDDSTSTSEST